MKFDKSSLFDDFIQATVSALGTFEHVFQLEDVCEKYFGLPTGQDYWSADSQTRETVRERVRASAAWRILTDLYDYAVDGVLAQRDIPEDIVIGGAEVLSLITLENSGPDDEWENVVALGDARFALDTERSLPADKLALLAAVDIRTVRNAISAGELKSSKTDATQWIDNASARTWLAGRRGYRPTRFTPAGESGLSDLKRPATFGGFLRTRRESLEKSSRDKELVASHPAIDERTVENLEAGVFQLPLDAVFPLADFYQVDRSELRETVMRVFFEKELAVLHQLSKSA